MVASTSTTAPLILVIGATGVQGGSVITHLLSSAREYRIRGVTRDVTKDKAKDLESKGVEVVKAELGSEGEVKKAMEGAEYVFAVTNFWEHGAEKEFADGKRLMEVAKSSGVKTVFWSGLPNVTEGSGGKYTHVEHFDTKAKITAHGKSLGVNVVDVQAACYFENFLTLMAPRKQEDGSFLFAFPVKPDAKVSFVSCGKDYGAFVVAAIESGDKGAEEVLACGDETTFPEIARVWSEATGKTAYYFQVPDEAFQAQAGQEMTQMLTWFSDFGYYGGKDVSPSQKLLDKPAQTWKEFVEAADWSKVIA